MTAKGAPLTAGRPPTKPAIMRSKIRQNSRKTGPHTTGLRIIPFSA